MRSMSLAQVVFETWLRTEDEIVASRRRKTDMAIACRMAFGSDAEAFEAFLDENRR